ncbi:dehydrogenase [Marinobacter halodurans]|uniref:Dehydrogenase n=1 Tax=Marinobacter halodurans TaxID=2528979 RepID=A0ABY1ZLV4_9GAMM|nr:dehydrogenase [Marinobacter halodurans]TBW53335.1 dehydrogenase [Marinobacter halodurans]
MKSIASISLGSSEDDYTLETHFLGEPVKVMRLGANGDLENAGRLLESVRFQVDAIGLSFPDTASGTLPASKAAKVAYLKQRAPDACIGTGEGLRGLLQEWAVRHVQTTLGHFFDNARVLILDGRSHYPIARALKEHTDNLAFANPSLDFGIPRLLTSLDQMDTYSTMADKLLERPATRWLRRTISHNPIWKLGKPLSDGAIRHAVAESHIIVVSPDQLPLLGKTDLDGKTLMTSRVTGDTLAWMKAHKVAMVVDDSPWLAGHPVGVNVLEALICATHSRTPEQLSADDFLQAIHATGIEPRILYPDGYRRVNRFAFVIHPLSQQYLTRAHPLDWISEVSPKPIMNLVEKAVAYTPPFVYSKVSGIHSPTGDEAEGWLITVGGTPHEIMAHRPEFTYERLLAAARLAKKLGAQIMGLGAFTKVVGDAGVTVARQAPLPITTGNSYSASGALWAAHEAARRIGRVRVGESGKLAGNAMVVGATGAIGSVCARLLAKAVETIYLASPEPAKLLALKESIEQETPGARVHVAATADKDVADMDMIVTATSGAGKRILDIMKVKPGCVITDVARPLDISAEDVARRPDVLVIESGEIELPGNVQMKDIGLPPGIVYACLAETIVLALEGRFENYTLGRHIEWGKVQEIYKLGLKHGMKLAAISGVNGAFTDEDFERVRQLSVPEQLLDDPATQSHDVSAEVPCNRKP